MNASGAPAWLAAVDKQLSALVPYSGVSIIVDLVVLQVLAGIGVLLSRRTRRSAVLLGVGLSLVYWVAGQDIGQFWSGITTDPNTAPLMMLLGVTVLGAAPWRQPSKARVSMMVNALRPGPATTSGRPTRSAAGRERARLSRRAAPAGHQPGQ